MTKEEEILAIAEEEFLDKGYDAASTAVIAKRAGVTHAMVNYYYRSKEKLFVTVMGLKMHELLGRIRSSMKADGPMIDGITDSALTVFDSFNSCRKLPFLILDIARTHPDFLMEHHTAAASVFEESFKQHVSRLSSEISDSARCSMENIYDSVFSLASAPFLLIPVLEKVMGMNQDQIESYLASHREEMVRLLRARYSDSYI